MMTLPMVCREKGLSLDGMRAFVRKRPELAKLGTDIGPSRAYTPDEVAKILTAWAGRPSAKERAAAGKA